MGRFKEDIRNIRDRAVIARCKTHASAQQCGAPAPRVSSGLPPDPSGSSLPDDKSSEGDAYKIITEFLAAGGADGRIDDDVWEALATLVSALLIYTCCFS